LDTQKLVTEKLSKVRHRPMLSFAELLNEPDVAKSSTFTSAIEQDELLSNTFRLKSAVDCAHGENHWIPLVAHVVPNPRGIIVLVHGLFEDNRAIYGFFVGELNRLGYTVYLTTLPFHYERRPDTSQFSGEFFFSADLGRTKRAFRQATVELNQVCTWLRHRHALPTYAVGFSMGGAIVLSSGAQTAHFDGICLVNPAAKLSNVVWSSPFCTTIKGDLLAAGLTSFEINAVLETFDPTLPGPQVPPIERILLIYGLFDQVTQPHQYEDLVSQLRLTNVLRYKAGHLNVLRVPRLAEDIARFFQFRSIPGSGLTQQGST
jgi:pimeloyl-ACP methyl ester carboxylesterase